MESVSSVTAFLFRYLSSADTDGDVREILAPLTTGERRMLELLARVPDRDERLRCLADGTNETWSAVRYRRAEALALNRLRRELLRRRLLRP